MVTGWAYASDPGSFHTLILSDGAAPREVLGSDTFLLTDVVDLDGDGVPEIVGKHSLSQAWGRCFTTYDPFAVYRLPSSSAATAERSLDLSERYNRSHYYGWVGPDASEDWAVVKCARGGPKIMKATEAERLFGK